MSHRWGSLEEGFSFISENFVEIEAFLRRFCNSDGRRNKTCQQLQVTRLLFLTTGCDMYVSSTLLFLLGVHQSLCINHDVYGSFERSSLVDHRFVLGIDLLDRCDVIHARLFVSFVSNPGSYSLNPLVPPQENYLDNVSERRLLLVEIALYSDVLTVLKTACLNLEGDYALAHKVCRRLEGRLSVSLLDAVG